MNTFTIVSKDKDPLGPNEIHADDTITVSDGDTYIIDPSADSNITFESADVTPTDFNIDFPGSNANDFKITVEDNLTPSVAIGDNANLADIDFDAKSADGVIFDAGDNVSFGQFDGSTTGPNDIVIGNDFSTDKNWKLGDADDSIIVGDDATFQDIDTGSGNDTVMFGDRATVKNVDTKEGDDDVRFGDDLDANDIKTGKGDDDVYFGPNAQANDVDGGEDNDTFKTETGGQGEKNFEDSQVVCYAPGTLIDTPDGSRAVETLRPGDLVLTVDHGLQPIRWVRSGDHPLEGAEVEDKPVLIQAGALGAGRPAQDLIVSPQHRVLVGGRGQLTQYFDAQAFAPAKALTGLPGIRHLKGKTKVTWVHFACYRHEVVIANGCYSESLLLGPMVLDGLSHAERKALHDIYGPASSGDAALNGPAAHECLKVGEVRRYLAKRKKDSERHRASDIKKWDVDLAMEKYETDRLRIAVA